MPRCKSCDNKFDVKYFLQKTCSIQCEKEHLNLNPKKQIKKVSDKRSEELNRYHKERSLFLVGKLCPVKSVPATEIHHTNGRTNKRLNDVNYWLPVSRLGHAWIHANPKESRLKGWLI